MAVAAVPAGPTDVPALEDVLQAAFWDDPLTAFLFPDERSRSWRSALMFRAVLLHHYVPMRTVWTTSDQAGVAMWAPPDHWKLTPREVLRSLPTALRGLGVRMRTSVRLLAEVDRHHPTQPHWYLGVLGTDPPRQGRGIGSALMAPVLERCDREGLPAYLESSKESNIPFYGRHGFVVTRELRAPGAPPLYAMWREPS
jgi:GNAT superfamily N-acetyltransferase